MTILPEDIRKAQVEYANKGNSLQFRFHRRVEHKVPENLKLEFRDFIALDIFGNQPYSNSDTNSVAYIQRAFKLTREEAAEVYEEYKKVFFP